MLKEFKADLHIHTCLSPCTDFEMAPSRIIEKSRENKLDLIAICDHNSSENVDALMKACHDQKIRVIPGMEVTSKEEVHILALFENRDKAIEFQEVIYDNLPGKNEEDLYGMQVVVNEKGEVIDFNQKLLIGATTLSVEDIVEYIHSFNGLAIASHIDREAFSIIGQLGFIPPDLELDALEISPRIDYYEAQGKFNFSFPLICSSDAHYLDEIGRGFTIFLIESANIYEIKKALKEENGRKILKVSRNV
ncbi:PHP domain-containing protein [Candidatus Aminicenantes bacterium AC-335-B20]|jgi:hypothetical protein|nr:PHP domain-containing protein [SCandidatus Aminicenantes bacterium Aminicenantia_JdfR_composite]MCP2596603.1 PHP domain-containing protein [Candidatus Aminicenantes bacterium AC-335-G13]MCP2598071.1 PHP domain-containing protein [Candidatus Aminicenantes bacterium AC-335-L06]MCP2598961.1 PHP domain-containing protein [Candidatus Aminicenantes bacterium AC-335-B20]MCP2605791.1 PHP domain-containing protein [Candidatus Aminicenantes bacterium AC-335-O07]MCP2606311.1 PHP domain-containing prot